MASTAFDLKSLHFVLQQLFQHQEICLRFFLSEKEPFLARRLSCGLPDRGYELVCQSVVNVHAILGKPLEQLIDKVASCVRSIWIDVFPCYRLPLALLNFPVRVLGELFRRATQVLDDFLELVRQVFPRHEGLATVKLRHNAPNGPHIHRLSVAARTQNEFWGTVPAGSHVVCDGLRGEFVGSTKSARESKVADFEISPVADEDVAWLQVSVDNPRRVDVLHGTKNLVREVTHVELQELEGVVEHSR